MLEGINEKRQKRCLWRRAVYFGLTVVKKEALADWVTPLGLHGFCQAFVLFIFQSHLNLPTLLLNNLPSLPLFDTFWQWGEILHPFKHIGTEKWHSKGNCSLILHKGVRDHKGTEIFEMGRGQSIVQDSPSPPFDFSHFIAAITL